MPTQNCRHHLSNGNPHYFWDMSGYPHHHALPESIKGYHHFQPPQKLINDWWQGLHVRPRCRLPARRWKRDRAPGSSKRSLLPPRLSEARSQTSGRCRQGDTSCSDGDWYRQTLCCRRYQSFCAGNACGCRFGAELKTRPARLSSPTRNDYARSSAEQRDGGKAEIVVTRATCCWR